jgi:small subunit ribosomal protein S6
MRDYELYLVIDAAAEEEDAGAVIERVTELVGMGDGTTGGEVTKVDPRGKRRLAYPIKKKTESHDFIVTLQTMPEALPELERYLKLNEHVLRYLIIRKDE